MNSMLWATDAGGDSGGLQSLNVRVRLVAAVCFAVVVLSLKHPATLTVALTVALLVVASSGLSWRVLLRRLLALQLLLVLLALSLLLSTPGDPLVVLGPLTLSQSGGELALVLVLRAHAILIALLGLLGTLDPVTFAHGLASLRLPQRLVTLLLITVRQIDLLLLEYQRLRRAMRARAFVPQASRHGWRSLGWLIGMVLVRALARARRLDAAMRCRGFRGQFCRLDPPPWRALDTLASLLFGLMLIALLWFDSSGISG
ncbi:cobalt ECF transporter T component CbiQ [Rhabdochromatium marinum]|uniref:cobalt ECF transporter T component CbiQ n=1 Tax=Rhabdochromatium marinum TaxID=48729 RepID=UPI001904BA13|nr:cobalt ECF transporter T component CbiQ [Rhabdochromatium marinum]MBK1649768.1 cobalt ECF transporter T component CbiQ [Rhabdochromatium marinum]